MELQNIFLLLGGLGLFLYGMKMMGEGLELCAGARLKNILEKLTSNRLLGVIVGAVITAVIQSSSATTVMTVGFVNAGLMSLPQAISVIMGANIGTTITGQLIALDISEIAPIIAFVGVACMVFPKKKMVVHVGQIIAGLGILFMGMDIMGDAMVPLREVQAFRDMMTSFSNPLIGITVGAVFTGIIQSSSASVGILQTLAGEGLISLGSALYVLFGMNIGTCVTALLSSIGTNKNARRTALAHLFFNITGTIIFTILCLALPMATWIEGWTPNNPEAQIANAHTLFNIVTTVVLFPLAPQLAKFVTKILPGQDATPDDHMRLEYINQNTIGSSAVALDALQKEVDRMHSLAFDNIHMAVNSVCTRNNEQMQLIEQNEEVIDFLNKEISKSMVQIMGLELTPENSRTVNSLFMITNDLERIGDHALNIAEYTQRLIDQPIHFSLEATEELREMEKIIYEILEKSYSLSAKKELDEIEQIEQHVDDLTAAYKNAQLVRLHNHTCQAQAGVLFTELLTDLERIADHALNIAQERAACL